MTAKAAPAGPLLGGRQQRTSRAPATGGPADDEAEDLASGIRLQQLPLRSMDPANQPLPGHRDEHAVAVAFLEASQARSDVGHASRIPELTRQTRHALRIAGVGHADEERRSRRGPA